MAETVELNRSDLQIGDVLVSKADPSRTYHVEKIETGMSGHGWPYLVMRDRDGSGVEHDTSFDSPSATYTVRRDAQ
jgi:hypothetical protein